ncbi:hypothetical protein ACO2Q3_08475 [Caulobacter sp. KR2-114]|uniref:hypothetical protein n=1 Tax=Caulobacter sp. KR2-114 TaxID=3400912 RepID=UPI003BFBA1B2
MTFTGSANFPYWVGGVITAAAIVAEASGVLPNASAACLAMPGLLLLLDAGVGTSVLDYYFFANHPFTERRVQELYFARPKSLPRYLAALAWSAAFAVTVGVLRSEVLIAAGLVGSIVAYGLLAGAALIRCIRQAGREARLSIGT